MTNESNLGRVKTDTETVKKIAQYCYERLQPGTGITVSQMLDALADERDAANARVARLEGVLRWYGEQVSNCNRHGKEGDTARDTLAKDYGQRAEAALQTEGKEPDHD